MTEAGSENAITVYGTTWCGDCKRSKRFLAEQRIRYRWVDVEENPDGLRFIEEVNQGKHIVPTIVFPDGSILVEPSNADLAAKLGIPTKAQCSFCDLIIVGGGPAGLTAAIYAAREGIDTLVIERAGLGGQVGLTERLDNFPGFPEGVTGEEFAKRLEDQARRFEVEMLAAQKVVSINVDDGDYRVVHTASGDEYRASAIILAVGSTYRQLGVPGEEDFIGSGVHFCSTCDGPFYKGKDVLVVGGGNSAGEEAIFLTKFASKVTMVTIDPELTASQIVRQKVLEQPNIDIIYNTTVAAFNGDSRLRSVTLKDVRTGETKEATPAGVFVFIGLQPNTGFLKDLVKLDRWGFIETDATLQTSTPGIFAAGDCRAGSTKQAAAAAGEGATVALMVRQYLGQMKKVAPGV